MKTTSLIDKAVARNDELCVVTVILEPRSSLDSAIVRISDTKSGCHLVYSYEKLVEAFMRAHNWDHETADEWVSYNTVRSLPYMGGPKRMAPLIWSNATRHYV